MCTRFSFHEPERAIAAIAEALAAKLWPLPEWATRPRYNVAMTSRMPVVVIGETGPELRAMVWGLVPFYEQAKPRKRMLHNARSETAEKLPAFKQGVARRRCLVPACGFYEWQEVGGVKWPHLFTLKDDEPFAFAGIWEPGEGGTPETFSILTTVPNALVAPIHDRMPCILRPETMPRWLGTEPLSAETYLELTRAIPAEAMTERAVSRYVGNTRNEGPECHAPVEAAGGETPCGLGL